jgi:regulator of replication initiation timing
LEMYQRSKVMEDQLAQALLHGMATVREEARERNAEATEITDDIMYMTKENQTLHEETRVLEQRIDQLTGNARDQAAKHELASQRVRAIELERDDIAALYERVAWHTRQESLLVQRLRTRAEASTEVAAQLGGELSQAARSEDESEARATQLRLDRSVLAGQLQDIELRLAQEEQMYQSTLTDGARLESDMAAAVVAQGGAGRREAVHSHATAALGLRLPQIQAALIQVHADVAQYQRSTADAREQALRLEGLLEEERRRSRRCTAENESLRQCLETRQALPSSAASGAELANLRQEVEKRYTEVAAYDAEQQAMTAEAERLRQVLRLRLQPPREHHGVIQEEMTECDGDVSH